MQNIRYEFVEKPVTAWGGMRMMKELIDRTGIKKFMEKLPLPKPGSNRGYPPIQIIESFWVSIWIGASRFVHSGWLRYDKVLKDILSLMRQMVLQENRQSTLKILKLKCFALVGTILRRSWIVKGSRGKVLRISTSGRKKEWLEELFSKVEELSPPFSFSNA